MVDEIVARASGLNRRALLAALALASTGVVVMFASYCWLHAVVSGAAIGWEIALRWGIVAGFGTLVLLGLGMSARRRMASWLSRGPLAKMAVFIVLLNLIGLSTAVLHATALVPQPGNTLGGSLPLLFFDAVPMAAGLAILLMIVPFVHSSPPRHPAPPVAQPPTDWLTVPEMPNLRLRSQDVEAIRSAGNYCELRADGRTYLIRVPMKVMEERLEAHGFVRVHRTCLVNARRVERVVPAPDRRAPMIHLDTGEAVPVGRAFRGALSAIGGPDNRH